MKISWNMLYQVCSGRRNFGKDRAKLVANLTGTDPMIWIDPLHAAKRARFMSFIEDELNIKRPKYKRKQKSEAKV